MMLAAVLTIPIGVLTSCATQATICASARYFSSSISVLATRCASSCRNRSSVVVRTTWTRFASTVESRVGARGMAARKAVRRSTNNWQGATASAVASRAPPSSRASSPNESPELARRSSISLPSSSARHSRTVPTRIRVSPSSPCRKTISPARRTRRARRLRPCEAVRQRCWQTAVSWKRRCERACQPQLRAGSTHLYWLEHSPASRPLHVTS